MDISTQPSDAPDLLHSKLLKIVKILSEKDRNKQLLNELKANRQQIKLLKEQNQQLELMLVDYQKQVNGKMNDMSMQKKQAQTLLEDQTNKINSLDTRVAELLKQNQELFAEISKLRIQTHLSHDIISHKKGLFENSQSSVISSQQTDKESSFVQLQELLQAKGLQIDELNEIKAQLQQQIQQQKVKSRKLKDRVDILESSLKQLKQEKRMLEAELGFLKTTVLPQETLFQEKKNGRKSLAKQTNEVLLLKKAVKAKEAELSQVSLERQELLKRVLKQEQKQKLMKEQFSNRLQQIKQKYRKQSGAQRLQTYEKSMQQMRLQVKQRQTHAQTLTKKVIKSEQQLFVFQEEINQLNLQLQDRDRAVKGILDKSVHLQSLLRQLQQRIIKNKQYSPIKLVQGECIQELRQSLRQLQAQRQFLKEELSQKQTHLELSLQKQSDLERRLLGVREECERELKMRERETQSLRMLERQARQREELLSRQLQCMQSQSKRKAQLLQAQFRRKQQQNHNQFEQFVALLQLKNSELQKILQSKEQRLEHAEAVNRKLEQKFRRRNNLKEELRSLRRHTNSINQLYQSIDHLRSRQI